MKAQQVNAPAEGSPPKQNMEMTEMWNAAEKAFESICHESLQRGEVKGFDDVQRMIDKATKPSYGIDTDKPDKWEKARTVGFNSLKYLKIPIPASAANITSSALFFVFNIPEAIKGYNDAIGDVFGEVSSALAQFHIYTSKKDIEPELVKNIHHVMISFVKLCAHVVKYRQSSTRKRILKQAKSIFEDDSGLRDEMAKFKQAQQHQHFIEGTLTLTMVVESKDNITSVLEELIIFGNINEEIHQVVQETQKGVQSLNDDAIRTKTLEKIRDTLGVDPKVHLNTNTTQTCTNIYNKWVKGTGSWIWEHDDYTAWTTPTKDKDPSSNILLVSGPQSSGKTTASALITKRLEEQKGRTYVAHYFFSASIKKSYDDNSPVQSALKYMAFQISRVDVTFQKELGKACEAGPGAIRRLASLDSLDMLWEELKIGAPVSGAVYYLVFDGLENLRGDQAKELLTFVFGPKIAGASPRRVRVLLSGTDELFDSNLSDDNSKSAMRIKMKDHNKSDMGIMIDNALTKEGVLQHAEPDSDQQKARVKIIEKLPQNVSGSYSLLQFGLSDVIRLLSTRTAVENLDLILDRSVTSHEVAIKELQRSLTVAEISELNELLKWVLFSSETLTLNQLEAAMFIYSNTKSLASLQYIIANKYSAILKLDDNYVYGQDGVKTFLQKKKETLAKPEDSSTISMTITINNVDQELCGHFLWDLAHKAIREKFNFNFDVASALHNSQAVIAVDEFEAHHTHVTRAFKYLESEHMKETKDIGAYLVLWLPYHLDKLRYLEENDKGTLTPPEKSVIGQSLYRLFKDDQIIRRHRVDFEPVYCWDVEEIEGLQKWLTDPAVVRKVDGMWREEARTAISPIWTFLKELVKIVVEGFLREREWNVASAYNWIDSFMDLDKKRLQQNTKPLISDAASSTSSTSSSFISATNDKIDWDGISYWCQSFLGLPDDELNSLWYERLAEAAATQYSKADTILLFYQLAIDKENPSWLCHRGLGVTHFGQNRTHTAIEHMELALKEAKKEGATPKPAAKDLAELRLLLGQYNYEVGNVETAATYYLDVRNSDDLDLEQAKEAQLGYLKSVLRFENVEGMREVLKTSLATEEGKGRIVSILKMIAQDLDHESLISKIFTVTKGHPDLLKGIVRAMERATATPALKEDRIAEMDEKDRFARDEICGVLLCDRGFAAYMYNESPSGAEALGEALLLWGKSRNLLVKLGGGNALIAQRRATTALAQHYFQSMVKGEHMDHIKALTELAEPESEIYQSDAVGFLGALYGLRGEKAKAREVFKPRIRLALQILSDNIIENDLDGFYSIYKTLYHYQDFIKATVALSLAGQPDLVTDELHFEAKDIVGNDDVNKERVLELVTNLAKETIKDAKTRFPDASQQVERITAARKYFDNLVAATETEPKVEAEGSELQGEVDGSEFQGEQREQAVRDPETELAHSLLFQKLSFLQLVHTPKINTDYFYTTFSCDGRTKNGKNCTNVADLEHELYHCIYCSNEFCHECLQRLRSPDDGADIMVCNATHQWLTIPRQGTDMYVGPRRKSVRMPKGARPTEDDTSILNIYYDEDGDGETTVEAWKEEVAAEWGLSLEDIREGVSRQAPSESEPDEGELDEEKEDVE